MTSAPSTSHLGSRQHRELTYVTDNDRDAEALRRQTEMPVTVQRREQLKLGAYLHLIADRVSVQTLEAPGRLDAQGLER